MGFLHRGQMGEGYENQLGRAGGIHQAKLDCWRAGRWSGPVANRWRGQPLDNQH